MKELLFALCLVSTAHGIAQADIVCPDSSTVTVTFVNTNHRINISPGTAEPWAFIADIRVCLKDCSGTPLAGVPAESITLENPGLCICPGGMNAASPTDVNGCTRFDGYPRAGGCVEFLDVVADGVHLGSIPVQTVSGDFPSASPCFVDQSDLSSIAQRLGISSRYSRCWDLNRSGGPTIDASDLSYWGTEFRGRCE